MILVIDNYDSFTYNLVQHIGEVSEENIPLQVYRNDALSIDQISNISPTHIVISPGPCTPNEAGISIEVVKTFYKQLPILGVCLGHQAIAQALGGTIIRAKEVFHGKTSKIKHDNKGIFKDLEPNFIATRYHSLSVERSSLPDCFEISALTTDAEIMALRHKTYPNLNGIQFHPESFLTTEGKKLLKAFLEL